MPLAITNRSEKGSPLTMLEMDNDILERIVDAINGLEALMSISLNADGTLKNPGFFSASSTNGTDTYTATVSGVTSQAGLLGKALFLKVDVANVGASTLNVNSYGAFPIVKFGSLPIDSNDLKATKYSILTWDGTNYILQSFPGVVQPENYALDTGAANALVVTQSGSVFIPETLTAGYSVRVKVAAANTGPVQISLGSPPVIKSIKRSDLTDLLSGDLTVNKIVDLVYDGTFFQAVQLGTAKSFVALGNDLSTYAGGNAEFAHGLGGLPEIFQVCVVCNTAEHGYSIDDIIDANSIQVNDPGTTERPSFSPYANSTHVGASVNNYGGGNRFGARHKTSGAPVSLTEASWDLQFRAFTL